MTRAALAPHTARNCQPILEVLRTEFRAHKTVLEIGSGTGQHATTVVNELDDLLWQTSDRQQNHPAIRQWLQEAAVPGVLAPIALDVLSDAYPAQKYDAVFSANTAHIMSLVAVEKMFELVASVLRENGIFCLYGPFRQDGRFSSESNSNFHRSLRAKDKEMGIRHLEELDIFSATGGLRRKGLYAMPANNLMLVWRRIEGESDGDS
jgi:cyclopropane fatty-acyl-phospholipid synthase-like methyltransferase